MKRFWNWLKLKWKTLVGGVSIGAIGGAGFALLAVPPKQYAAFMLTTTVSNAAFAAHYWYFIAVFAGYGVAAGLIVASVWLLFAWTVEKSVERTVEQRFNYTDVTT